MVCIVEDAIKAIQIHEGCPDARFGQELVNALHVRVVLQLLFVLFSITDSTDIRFLLFFFFPLSAVRIGAR
jgi:hypothetical protein